MRIYFAEVMNINDPLKAGRVQVKVVSLEPFQDPTEMINSEWFHCIVTSDTSLPYQLGDRVAVTFLNESANNGGLVLGRVNVLGLEGLLTETKRNTNKVELGLYETSSFNAGRISHPIPIIDPIINFSPYPETITPIYNDSFLIASDLKNTLIQDKKGSFIFFDFLSNLFIKSISKMFIYCLTQMLLYSNTNIEIRVGLDSKIEISNEKIDISIRGSRIILSDLGVQIIGPSIWMN